MKNNVSLKIIDDYNMDKINDAIKESFSLLNVSSIIKPRVKVLLKVCLPHDDTPDRAETSHPFIVRGVVNALNQCGVDCILADSPYDNYSQSHLETVYLNTGMISVANNTKCTLNNNLKTYTIETPNGVKTKSLTLLDVLNEVDVVVNLGKVKIDDRLGYTGASANMFGLIPGEYKKLILNRLDTVADYNNYIVDIIDALKDKLVLNIIDGVVAIEAGGSQHMLSMIAMSENVFSLDAVILNILGIEYKNSIINIASKRQFIDIDKPFKTVGDDIELFRVEDFKLNKVDLNSKIHKSKGRKRSYFNTHQNRVVIDKNRCKGCTICSKICPAGAIIMKYDKQGELYAHIDYDKCIFCNKCRSACPYSIVDVKNPPAYRRLNTQINKYNNEN